MIIYTFSNIICFIGFLIYHYKVLYNACIFCKYFMTTLYNIQFFMIYSLKSLYKTYQVKVVNYIVKTLHLDLLIIYLICLFLKEFNYILTLPLCIFLFSLSSMKFCFTCLEFMVLGDKTSFLVGFFGEVRGSSLVALRILVLLPDQGLNSCPPQ